MIFNVGQPEPWVAFLVTVAIIRFSTVDILGTLTPTRTRAAG